MHRYLPQGHLADSLDERKGDIHVDALKVLNSVVTRMQAHQQKKTARFRALHW